MTKEQILINLIKNDKWMMDVLRIAEGLNLPDWIIGAGFVRNKVWDYLHNIKRNVADTNDIDLVYFDSKNSDEEIDKKLSEKMKGVLGLKWEIVNQSYVHKWREKRKPYKNTTEALSEWVETATCVAVKLLNGELQIIAPHSLDDLFNLIIRPAPYHNNNLALFHKRINDKKWLEKWPKLKVIEK